MWKRLKKMYMLRERHLKERGRDKKYETVRIKDSGNVDRKRALGLCHSIYHKVSLD